MCRKGRHHCCCSALNGVYTYLTVEDIVWCVLLKLEVPDESDSIWVVGDVLVGEVGDEQELWVLRRVCVCVCVGGGWNKIWYVSSMIQCTLFQEECTCTCSLSSFQEELVDRTELA